MVQIISFQCLDFPTVFDVIDKPHEKPDGPTNLTVADQRDLEGVLKVDDDS